MNCKIKMATTHRLNVLFIILISGFKLGMAAPADGTKGNGKKRGNDDRKLVQCFDAKCFG